MIEAIVNFLDGSLVHHVLHALAFVGGAATAVIFEEKYPRMYDSFAVMVIKFINKFKF